MVNTYTDIIFIAIICILIVFKFCYIIIGSKDTIAFYTKIQDIRTELARCDDDIHRGWGTSHLLSIKNTLTIPPAALSTDFSVISKKEKVSVNQKTLPIRIVDLRIHLLIVHVTV